MAQDTTTREAVMVDGNEAVASVAYRLNDVIAIYPITPASAMGELADEWAATGRPNLWGLPPEVIEMQSEGGAIGAVHGALQAGSLATTFTASQGLLLMIPNLYKIAGELTPFVVHVAARTVATHALSIFGDHSDVMACRQTGLAMLASGSVQEASDFALIAHAATLRSRVPFLHFFDGFRTSHEISRVEPLTDDDLRALVNPTDIEAHRARALTPDHPVVRGTAQNPDVFFQAREAANPFYLACPAVVRETMEALAARTGRQYRLFDYVGHPEATRVIVMMGSGAETAHETIDWMNSRGERVGLVKVRLYRPFSVHDFLEALPASVQAIAVLDRTKEPGAIGEPLYLDVVSALQEAALAPAQNRPIQRSQPRVIGGRYGLSSKEFSPAMVTAVFDELVKPHPRPHFTVGIVDDVTHLSLAIDPEFTIEQPDVTRAIFYGLGSDGTVGANKNSIKIIAERTSAWAQGYFVYDSKKAGASTISHLRFGPRRIRSAHLVRHAHFVGCHQFDFLDRYDVLEHAAPGAHFLLNAPYDAASVWNHLPRAVQERIIELGLTVHVIDAYKCAFEAGLPGRINVALQTCFFALMGVLPVDEAKAAIKQAIAKTYADSGEAVVQRNTDIVDRALAYLQRVDVPVCATAGPPRRARVPDNAPSFVARVTSAMLANHGDLLPVSAFPVDGTWPVGTSRYEKRNMAQDIPVWDAELCIQCNKCTLLCPHAAIRAKVYQPAALAGAPPTFKWTAYRGAEFEGQEYTIQVAPEDCTGCGLCASICPVKDKTNPSHKALDMQPQRPLREQEAGNHEFFVAIPDVPKTAVKRDVKGSQLLTPLFEYSNACAGCGETPYLKLLTQLFGDRALIANATGCSSIYGGNLPTTPYTMNHEGRGPAWSNSLFEDNAEFGLGMRIAVDRQEKQARALLVALASVVGDRLTHELLNADQTTEAGIEAQRDRVTALRMRLATCVDERARLLDHLADALVRKSVWIVGGDGWAYDIGYGGLDHVLASGRDVNILVLDTEVYSNTGGQQSKATPLAASAKFAAAGKSVPKKDLGLEAMVHEHAYVACVALGAKDTHAVKAFAEADSYPGPSLIIAYSPCIAHGYDLVHGAEHQKQAVEVGYWPLYRFDPRRTADGLNPLQLDSKPPHGEMAAYLRTEGRFQTIERQNPQRFRALLESAQRDATIRYALYQHLAGFTPAPHPDGEGRARIDELR
jgi:pyruvate-ferredoxin/flavodoxin oxidoreductase